MDIKELIGVTLGTCTLEHVIGHGGMGAVYLAQQSRPVRTVAVKVLIPSNRTEVEQKEVFLERFRREADTIAKLEHKNILPIYEYDEAVVEQERLAYLVMPFIRGGTLRERIDEMNRSGSHIELKLVASYISQVADALDYAHSLGVVHRDIKPGNLLFHQDGRLMLGDFGIVRLKAMPSLTSVGSFLGTAEYASPEQISTNEIDFRSDIYSLGAILFELLTGSAPYTGPNPFAVMAKKLHDPLPSIRDSRPDLSAAVETVVMKALAKNPADRYQSASALADALQTAIDSGAVVSADVKKYREGKRLFYYFTLLITLLTQLLVFILVDAPTKDGTEVVAMFGVLLGCGLNVLILAAIGFTGVVRNRAVRKFVIRALTIAIITPILSGVFISYGAPSNSSHLPAYLVLLVSNLYLLRQLGKVDADKEQVEVAPVLWRPAFAGALTGLLPLTIMMIFALPAFFVYPSNSLPWLDVLGVLFVIAIGIPTPGAMMAVWLSTKMSFATLSRSSAIAGLLMFSGAFLLAVLWNMVFSSHSIVYTHLNKTWMALLIIVIVMSLVGALRGMLDAWISRRFLRKDKTNI